MALIIAGLSFFNSGPAHAHATILSTSPAHGSELNDAPTELRVSFSEPVTLGGLSMISALRDSRGEEVKTKPAELDENGTVLVVPLPPDLPKDVYLFSWRVISADTHPVGGSIQFAFGVPLGAVDAEGGTPEPHPGLELAVGVAKGAVYLGLVLAFGLLPTALLLGFPRTQVLRKALLGGLALTAVASLCQLWAQFLWINSVSSEGGDDPWAFLATEYAVAVWFRVGIIFVAGLFALSAAGAGRVWRSLLYLALGVVSTATVVVNGHGGGGAIWLLISILIHGMAATVWMGGLLLLAWILVLAKKRDARGLRFHRWSLLAMTCVALLVISGTVQSINSVGFLRALEDTSYGRILILKLVLVVAMVGLGLYSFLALRRDRASSLINGFRARRQLIWETGIGVVVVILSGVLSSVTPAREEWAPVVAENTVIGPYEVTLDVVPTRVGPQTMRVRVLPPHRDTPRPEEIEIDLRQGGESVDNVSVDFNYRIPEPYDPQGPSATSFVSSAFSIPSAGEWEANITLIVDRMEQYSGIITYRVY